MTITTDCPRCGTNCPADELAGAREAGLTPQPGQIWRLKYWADGSGQMGTCPVCLGEADWIVVDDANRDSDEEIAHQDRVWNLAEHDYEMRRERTAGRQVSFADRWLTDGAEDE